MSAETESGVSTALDRLHVGVPDELRGPDLKRWLLWKRVTKAGTDKPTKVPYYASGVIRHGEQGGDADRAALVTFDVAMAAARKGSDYAGVGLAMLGDNLIALDFDHCVTDGVVAPGLIDWLGDTYAELSPSGTGVRAFFSGTMPEGYRDRKNHDVGNGVGVEVFSYVGFVTVTGERLNANGVASISPDFVAALCDQFKDAQSGTMRKDVLAMAVTSDPVLEALRKRDMLIKNCGAGKFAVRCPFESEHTSAGGVADTAYFAPHTNGFSKGNFNCLHSHCSERPQSEFLTAIGLTSAEVVEEKENQRITEDEAALVFTDAYATTLRYSAEMSRWYGWSGTHWGHDRTHAVYDLIRKRCRTLRNAKLRTAAAVAAIERLAKTDRRHAVLISDFDADPWLLNTPGGVVDLRTGAIGPHTPSMLMTKITRATPRGTCPRWLTFLHRVADGDVELISFLQRMVGYALTASVREHALFFLYGVGANGKGVFLNTATWVLGDYATVAPMTTFQASQNEGHPTDMALLDGARLVVAQETQEGRKWDETRIKALTGGDPVTARFMRCDFFTFDPKFKLIFAGNHLPALKSVDNAMRRRLNMIPFTVQIPKAERDENLSEKLRAEADGIMAWALEGCLAWQRDGLNPPARVLAATDQYFEAEDSLTTWLGECCERGPGYWETPSLLFNSWRQWCEKAGEAPGTGKALGHQLDKAGFESDRTKNARRRLGLRLNADEANSLAGRDRTESIQAWRR